MRLHDFFETKQIAKDTNIPFDQCPHCGGNIVHESQLSEKQDACYHKVKSRYKVWPSAYASGALVQCRKKGAANWGNKSESVEGLDEDLRKWFNQKWVRFGPDGKIRGDCARGDDSEGKPKCLPQSKAHALGKEGRASAAARKRRQDPDADRRGPARNVATKNEGREFGAYYHEQLAQKVFDQDPNLDASGRADAVLDAAYPMVKAQMGDRQARALFNYDPDFASDLVTAYADLQRQGMGESDMSGIMHAAKNLNKSFIITADVAEGGRKKYRIRAQSERVAREKFSRHFSMAKIVDIQEED